MQVVARGEIIKQGRVEMTICPVAMAVGCKKCPVFGLCPLKGVIGDYKKEDEGQTKPQPDNVNK
jgi:hypothetical protein